MLRKNPDRKAKRSDGHFVIVASRYNARFVDSMLRAAKAELLRAKAQVQVVRVPGAYEIPIVAARLAASSRNTSTLGSAATEDGQHATRCSAILCLGVILRGETTHAAHIGEAVSRALMDIQVAHGVPVIHEVLLLENELQARVRCLDPNHNRGHEAAQTALAMAEVMANLPTVS